MAMINDHEGLERGPRDARGVRQADGMHHAPGSPFVRSRGPYAILCAAIVLGAGAGVGVYWFIASSSPGGGFPYAAGNGVTFDEMYAALSVAANRTQGGPWTLFSISGVASESPLAMVPTLNTTPQQSFNETMRLCGRLPGVTAWNMTLLPVFTGSMASGAAPFWSLLFKNASGSILYATFIEGKVRVYPPSPIVQACAEAAGLTSGGPVHPQFDSSTVGRAAYAESGANFSRSNSPFAVVYALGAPQMWNVDSSDWWIANYQRCGLAYVPAGIQNYTDVLVAGNGERFVDTGWVSCTAVRNSTGEPTPEHLVFSQPMATKMGGSQYVTIPFQVEFKVGPNGTTNYFDGYDLQPWMLTLGLRNHQGQLLPAAPSSCSVWVPSLMNCTSGSDGWFAVLQSAGDQWLDSYSFGPTNASGGWAYPNVVIVSHQQIVIVVPPSCNLTGDTLSVSSAAPVPIVNGTTAL